MPVMYMHLQYEEYKFLEEQMRVFKETSHKSEGGFYHKSIRLHAGELIIEFHGPLVGGYGHLENQNGQQQRPEGHRGETEGQGEPRPQPRTSSQDRHQSSALSNDCDQDEGA